MSAPTYDPHVASPVFSEDEAPYVTETRADILAVLRGAHAKRLPVTAYLDDGVSFALTTIAGVEADGGEIAFDAPPDAGLAGQLAASNPVVLVANQEGIQIKFVIDRLHPARRDGQPALAGKLPTAMLRMQRRESYRIPCPIAQPLKCTIPVAVHDRTVKAALVVLDLSCGGVALMDDNPHVNLEAGSVHRGCSIELPGVGIVTTDIEVRNGFDVELKNGTIARRAGCRFLNPPAAVASLVQRYIMKLERERNPRFGRS